MSRACSKYRRGEMHTGFWWESLSRLLERCRHKWEHNIETGVLEVGCWGVA
jgi:hypothetical protein